MSVFNELRRRNVIRVAAAYIAVSWLAIQVVETLFPLFALSDAAARAVVIVFAVGFIPVIVFAWVFELTPEGLKRDGDVDRSAPGLRELGKRIDRIIMLVLALAVAFFAVDKFVLTPQRESSRELQQQAEIEQARQVGRADALVESYGDKSIAVLPFIDMSPAGDQAHFADGISEELLNLLAGIKELRVISRSSSFALREAGLSLPEVAQKLNVSYILEGSIRLSGEQVRIKAQLIEARTDTHLWSDTWDRTLDNIFAIQDEISTIVAQQLKVQLINPVSSSGIAETAAYRSYLQGLSHFARRKPENIRHAINLFEQVISADPAYAPAYASLALALVWSDLDNATR
ncbi:MAG: hypothetical protein GQ538_08200, partial [Xanthomonadales bacterium]|nr:hypothetical protein [Xanthomonadales bacterium]